MEWVDILTKIKGLSDRDHSEVRLRIDTRRYGLSMEIISAVTSYGKPGQVEV